MEDQTIHNRIQNVIKKDNDRANNPVIQAYTSIFLTYDIIENFVSNALSHVKISRTAQSILHILIVNGGSMTATEISKQLWRTKYSTIRVIDTLEKEGYVKRILPDRTGDRRKKLISITEKGVALSEEIMELSDTKLCYQALQGLTEEQLRVLFQLLTHIGKNTFDLINDPTNSYVYRTI